ncbi:hypothetical protein DPMN_080200 [Dreissena polymorpha]|uniref:Uncharacterized protein n=1 Tax=Dreissena polymorpha TaxID=45954 RepID=A0A9D4BJ10_DREPO|nr:hypothetical protein DPMN_080200 [Dreissena polymorpha]
MVEASVTRTHHLQTNLDAGPVDLLDVKATYATSPTPAAARATAGTNQAMFLESSKNVRYLKY